MKPDPLAEARRDLAQAEALNQTEGFGPSLLDYDVERARKALRKLEAANQAPR